MGAAALFLVLVGGVAYAADGPLAGQNTIGSEDIIGNEVLSDDIGNGRIFNLDIADEIIQSGKIKNGTLTADDLGSESVGGSEVALNSLGGSDINERALVLESFIDVNGTCSPGAALVTCASVDLPDDMNSVALAFATVKWTTDMGGAAGACRFTSDGGDVVSSILPAGETESTDDQLHSMTLIDLVSFDLAGPNELQVRCNESEADITFSDIELTVLII